MKILTTITAVMALAGTAQAADLTGKIELDIAENAAGKYAATKTVGLEVTNVGPTFAGIDINAGADDALSVGDWHVGVSAAAATVSLGQQGNVWLDTTSASAFNTIADPAMGESLQVSAMGARVGLGFTDISTNIADVANLQGMYTAELGVASLTGALDYNLDSSKWIAGTRVGADVAGYASGLAVTYASSAWAFEADATAFGVTAYLNGDETDTLQNLGGKLVTQFGTGATIETSVNYDIDGKDLSPAVNLSFAF